MPLLSLMSDFDDLMRSDLLPLFFHWLGVSRGGEVILDSQLTIEIFKFVVIKLLSRFRDDDPWNFEPTNDFFLDEALDFCLCDPGKGFFLNPLGKVINYNK